MLTSQSLAPVTNSTASKCLCGWASPQTLSVTPEDTDTAAFTGSFRPPPNAPDFIPFCVREGHPVTVVLEEQAGPVNYLHVKQQ